MPAMDQKGCKLLVDFFDLIYSDKGPILWLGVLSGSNIFLELQRFKVAAGVKIWLNKRKEKIEDESLDENHA